MRFVILIEPTATGFRHTCPTCRAASRPGKLAKKRYN